MDQHNTALEVINGGACEAQSALARELVELWPVLTRRALMLTQDQSEADDLVQQTLERALLNRHRFRSGTNARAWAMSIMRNLFIDERRRCRIVCSLSGVEVEEIGQEPSAEFDPLDLINDDDVRSAVAGLKECDRALFALAYSEGLSYREIAARTGIRANTVGTRLFRIRARVRAALQALTAGRLPPAVERS